MYIKITNSNEDVLLSIYLSADGFARLMGAHIGGRGRLPLDKRIVYERFEYGDERLLVVAQYLERDLARLAEDALVAERAHGLDHVVREAEGHDLGHAERLALVEQAVEVDVYAVAVGRGHEDVLAVAVAEAEHVAADAHDGGRAHVVGASVVPRVGLGKRAQEPLVEHRRPIALQEELVDLERVLLVLADLVLVLLPLGRGDRADAALRVQLDQDGAQRGEILDPLDDAAVLVERRDGVRANVEVAAARLGLLLEALVDDAEELHDAVVDAQVVLGLAQERVEFAVRAAYGHLLGLLQRVHDQHRVLEAADVDELERIRIVRAEVLRRRVQHVRRVVRLARQYARRAVMGGRRAPAASAARLVARQLECDLILVRRRSQILEYIWSSNLI